jgi:hypothetical protein
MLNNKTIKSLVLIVVLSFSYAHAQSTYNSVYTIFQSKCVACHNADTLAGSLDLGAADSVVYTGIVNANPVNATALGKFNKLISPGDPHRSFLLRKINNGLDDDNGITTGEGMACPQDTNTMLSNNEIELIRQWIYFGAPKTGNVVDTAVINKYYSGLGINATPDSHPLPTDPGSFQIHIGKIFLNSQTEIEYFMKHDLKLPDTVDVNRIELFMPAHSHHFIIYKLEPGAESQFPDGIRIQNPQNGQGSSNGNNTLVSAWQYTHDMVLPSGTAYQWATATILDMNHHLFNPNVDSVIATDVYINVYTQPKHTAPSVMYSELVTNTNIFIFNNGNDFEFTKADYNNNATRMWNVWLLSSHTHKYGKDFDIYKRNPNGSLGDQLFEGWYNTDYSFNQGYYDWEHPPTEKFDPMVEVNPQYGLIQKAVYNNTGNLPVTFGLTTKDEMMLYFIQYTLGAQITTGIESQDKNLIQLNTSPNPYTTATTISYQLTEQSTVNVEVYDVLGKKLNTLLANETQTPGAHKLDFNAQQYGYPEGIYILKININGEQFSKRIIQTKN